MKASKTKTTVIAIIALIIVCGGSFAGVKLLNSSATVQTVVSTIATTLSAPSSAPTTATTNQTAIIPEVTTMAPATTQPLDIQSLTAENDAAEVPSDEIDKYSTFSVASTESTTKSVSDAASAANQNITTAPSTTKNANDIEVTSEAEAQDLIRQAAVFSDGFLGYLYDPKGNFFYTSDDPWQRYMGFNQIFDAGAPFVAFYYDTMRCKFRYDNMDWMIQFWKGQYGWIFVGCEIGVYYKPTDRTIEHYDCVPDEDTLKMSLSFYRKGNEVATREYARYWWCTAFVPGTLDKFSDRSELEVRARITMKDPIMLLAFCNALKKNGCKLNEDFTVNGLDVFIIY